MDDVLTNVLMVLGIALGLILEVFRELGVWMWESLTHWIT